MMIYEDGLLTEQVIVEDGTLVINRNYMALRTPDGVLHPAGLDKYMQYQSVFELIQLISCNADLTTDITEEARQILLEAFAGEHPTLSYPLVGFGDASGMKRQILEHIKPSTQADFLKVLCLNRTSGLEADDLAQLPFTNREELRDLLGQFMCSSDAYGISETVRKGKLYGVQELTGQSLRKYERQLNKLPKGMMKLFTKIKYLPSKAINELVIHYAIIAAKSIAKNGEYVVICGE